MADSGCDFGGARGGDSGGPAGVVAAGAENQAPYYPLKKEVVIYGHEFRYFFMCI